MSKGKWPTDEIDTKPAGDPVPTLMEMHPVAFGAMLIAAKLHGQNATLSVIPRQAVERAKEVWAKYLEMQSEDR